MSEKKHWQWLSIKLSEWSDKGLITRDQSEKILSERPLCKDENLLTKILISISALLFGLGIISFFAYNWQYMSKWTKIIVLFSAFISFHLAGLFLGKNPEKKNISEFFYLLGTFMFGANIILLAQIYHINEHASNGILLWSFGALIMTYILNSTPQMLVYAFLAVIWQSMERAYDLHQTWSLLYVAFAMVPFAIMKKHWFSVSITTVTLIIVMAIQLTYYFIGIAGILFFLSVLCLGTGICIRRTAHIDCAYPVERAGYILYFIMLVVISYSDGVKHAFIYSYEYYWGTLEKNLSYPTIVALLTLIVWSAFFFPLESFKTRFMALKRKHIFLCLVAFIWAVFIWSFGNTLYRGNSTELSNLALIGMIGFNLIGIAQGLILVYTGTNSGYLLKSFTGCVLLVAIILSRFFNYSDDLMTRSFAFIIAGGFVLWIAIKTSKTRKELNVYE